MNIRDAIESFMFYKTKNAVLTQAWYRQRLGVFADWCESQNLTLDTLKAVEVQKYINHLKEVISDRTGKPLASATIHGHARIIKTFLLWCSHDDVFDIVSEKTARRVHVPKIDYKIVDVFSVDEIKAMFQSCLKQKTAQLQARDRAIILVLLDTGVRAGELCGLLLENVHLSPADSYIKVFGKGRKEREIGLSKQTATTLHKYIIRYRRSNKTVPYLFVNRSHNQLTSCGLDLMLYRLARRSGVEKVYAHKFRHTFAYHYLAAGGDIFKLSRLMGHSNTVTTQIYLKAFSSRQARQGGISIIESMGLNS